MQEFYKKVPKDCVPTTYGGYYESMPAMNGNVFFSISKLVTFQE